MENAQLTTEEIRRELNYLQREVLALISDLSDLETRLENLREKATNLYNRTNEELDR